MGELVGWKHSMHPKVLDMGNTAENRPREVNSVLPLRWEEMTHVSFNNLHLILS